MSCDLAEKFEVFLLWIYVQELHATQD